MAKEKFRSIRVLMSDKDVQKFKIHMMGLGYVESRGSIKWEALRMVHPEISGKMRTVILYRRKKGMITIPGYATGIYRMFEMGDSPLREMGMGDVTT